ncbi:hypothetical protein D3C85_1036600 [compost metagenome]
MKCNLLLQLLNFLQTSVRHLTQLLQHGGVGIVYRMLHNRFCFPIQDGTDDNCDQQHGDVRAEQHHHHAAGTFAEWKLEAIRFHIFC